MPYYCQVVNNLGGAILRRTPSIEYRPRKISALARRRDLDPRRVPVICTRNGKPILQKQWRRVKARHGDIVEFTVLPRGATARTVASLAILVVAAIAAPYLAPALAGVFGIGAGTAAFAGLTAATTAVLAPGGDYQLDAVAASI